MFLRLASWKYQTKQLYTRLADIPYFTATAWRASCADAPLSRKMK